MNKTVKHIPCNQCKTQMPYDVYDIVNVIEDDTLKEKVLNDELFVVRCPNCGKLYYLSYEFIYNDNDTRLMICFGNNSDTRYEQFKEEIRRVKQLNPMIEYEFRFVNDYEKLREKIRIFSRGYDDRIIELYKYEYLMNGYDNEWNHLDDIVFANYDGSVENVFVLFEKDGTDGVRAIAFNEMEYIRLEKEYSDYLYLMKDEYDVDLVWAQKLYELTEEYKQNIDAL